MGRQQRQMTAEFKIETVKEILGGQKPIAQLCGERQVTDWLVYKWRQEFLAKAPRVFENKAQGNQHNEQMEKMAELERLVGQLTLENSAQKKGSSWLEAAWRKNGQ